MIDQIRDREMVPSLSLSLFLSLSLSLSLSLYIYIYVCVCEWVGERLRKRMTETDLVSLFNGISTFVCYLMPKLSLR